MNNAGSPLIAGIISQTNLVQAESELGGVIHSRLLLCPVLEIRYDLFQNVKDWPLLAGRVRALHPTAKIIGTIRLKRDGGALEDSIVKERLWLWESILSADVVPLWIDLELFALGPEALLLKEMASAKGSRLFISMHDFLKIPTTPELELLAKRAIDFGACGIKVAAMSRSHGDSFPLYDFLRRIESQFELRAAFAMGVSGSVSRVWSLAMGANLTYGSISEVPVPGLLSVEKMIQAIQFLRECKTEEQMSLFLEEIRES
jgi:3-dehydroquinate dehydratase-1